MKVWTMATNRSAHPKITVSQDPDYPVTAEVMAKSIESIGRAVRGFQSQRMNYRALILLIADATGLGKGTVGTVLAALGDLESTYLRKKSGA
jgi:hypothetical protein